MYSLFVFALFLGVSLAYNCGDAPETNGCNVWGIVPNKGKFESACNKHDVCYSCGRAFGITKGQCDRAFKNNMYGICRRAWWRWGCERVANSYYKAVDWFGDRYYKKSSPSWCKHETWYRNECMPKPNRR